MSELHQICIDPAILIIKNCPCCGCIATFQIEVSDADLGRVTCNNCGLKTQLTTKSNAIKLWNRRDGCEVIYIKGESFIEKCKSYLWL